MNFQHSLNIFNFLFLIFRRDPEHLVKPLEPGASELDITKRESDVQKNQPKSKRAIILVRHGQYNLQATQDSERYLTDLGMIFSFQSQFRIKIQDQS